MNHENIKELLSLYIDNGLTEQEKKTIEKHLPGCEECQKELKEYKENYNFISTLEKENVPTGFKESIIKKVGEEMKEKEIKRNKKHLSLLERFKKFFTLPVKIPAGIIGLTAIILLIFITSLPISILNNSDSINNNLLREDGLSYQPQYFSQISEPNTMMRTADLSTKESADLLTNTTEQKIIKRANLVIERNNIDEINDLIINLIEGHNGYISDSRNWLNQNKQKYYWFELKVPADNFNLIVEQLSSREYGQVISRSISSQDVTEEYMDIEIRLKNLLYQEERYRDLLSKATEVEEILKIENELNRIRTENERIQGRKNYLDNQISYSTITVEFHQPEPISSGTPGIIRAIRNAISKMVEQFYRIIIFIGTMIPYLLILLIAYLIYKSRKRR